MPTPVHALVRAANQVLDTRRDTLAAADDLAVATTCLPEWTLVDFDMLRLHRALLRHRTDPDRWLYLVGSRDRLLPGRGRVPGRNFRFTAVCASGTEYALGTVPDIIGYAKDRFERAVWALGVYPWTLDRLPGERAEAERVLFALSRDLDYEAHVEAELARRDRRG